MGVVGAGGTQRGHVIAMVKKEDSGRGVARNAHKSDAVSVVREEQNGLRTKRGD
jgi:hypothetical protein